MTFDEISRELGETPSKIKRIYYSAYEKAREYVKRGDMNEKVDNEIQKELSYNYHTAFEADRIINMTEYFDEPPKNLIHLQN